jgi:hypothetical protein
MREAVARGVDARPGALAVAELVHDRDRFGRIGAGIADGGDTPSREHGVILCDVCERRGVVAVGVD